MIKSMAGSKIEVISTGSTWYTKNAANAWISTYVLQAEPIGRDGELLLMEHISKELYDTAYETPQIAELNKVIHNLKAQLSDKDYQIQWREQTMDHMHKDLEDADKQIKELKDDILVMIEDKQQPEEVE